MSSLVESVFLTLDFPKCFGVVHYGNDKDTGSWHCQCKGDNSSMADTATMNKKELTNKLSVSYSKIRNNINFVTQYLIVKRKRK